MTFKYRLKWFIESYFDEPDWDATDWAHPAWWRGEDHGVIGVCRLLKKDILNQRFRNPRGVTSNKELEELRNLISEYQRLLEEAVNALEFIHKDWPVLHAGTIDPVLRQCRQFSSKLLFLKERMRTMQGG